MAHRPKRQYLAALALLFPLSGWCGTAAAPADEALDPAKLAPLFKDFGPTTPGCALGIYRDGRILLEQGYGLADLSHGVPIRPDTLFDIASVSKQFTALAVLMLAKEGKLSLDDDLRRHLPELQALPPITVRQALQHTAGLPDYNEMMELAGHALENVTGDAEAWQLIRARPQLNFAAGSRYSYSNSGYFLAGQLVERLSSQKLGDWLKQRVFEPLGMKSTHVRTDHTQVVARRATAYRRGEGGGYVFDMSNWNQAGDGAVQTTIRDLARWDAELAAPRVLDPTVLQLMQTPGRLIDGQPIGYGYGLAVDRYRGLPRVQHGGAWGGYRAAYVRYPEQHLSLALTCNVAEANPAQLAQRIADQLMGDRLAKPAAAAAAPDLAGFDARIFLGQFVEADGLQVLSFEPGDGGQALRTRIGGNPAPMNPVEARRLLSASGLTEMVLAADGQSLRLMRKSDGRVQQFHRVVGAAPQGEALRSLAGRYRHAPLGIDRELVFKEGGLQVRGRGQDASALTPVGADLLLGPGYLLQIQRGAQGHVTGLTYNSERLRGVVLARE